MAALLQSVLEDRLQSFDDTALLVDDHFLAFIVVFEQLVVFRDGCDLLSQAFIVFFESREKLVHLLELREARLAIGALLELCILRLESLHAFLEQVEVLSHFLYLVLVQVDFLLEFAALHHHELL